MRPLLHWLSLAALAVPAVTALGGHLATQGWYTTFVRILPRLRPFEPIPPVDFLLDDLAPWLIALMVGASSCATAC